MREGERQVKNAEEIIRRGTTLPDIRVLKCLGHRKSR